MNNLAIIPARGGSKRILRKNIKDFLGKPIIAYSIEVALASNLFNEVMVSTDDEEIAEIALKYGATVPFMRSDKTANDFATTVEVLNEVVREYKNILIKEFDNVCCIYATAPLLKADHLRKGFNLLIENNCDSVFPIVPFSYPVHRGVKLNEAGKIEMVWKEFSSSRSQDLETIYHDAGQWYWYKPSRIKDSLFTENTSSIILNEIDVQDIDSYTDWKLAELKYELRLQSIK